MTMPTAATVATAPTAHNHLDFPIAQAPENEPGAGTSGTIAAFTRFSSRARSASDNCSSVRASSMSFRTEGDNSTMACLLALFLEHSVDVSTRQPQPRVNCVELESQ